MSEEEICAKCGRGFDKIKKLIDWTLVDDFYLCPTHNKQLESLIRKWLKGDK